MSDDYDYDDAARVQARSAFLWFVDHLPDFDPAWSADIQAAWMECFMRLWRWSCLIGKE